MNKIKVAILFGGKSSEYGVSLHSTASVLYNMPEEFEVSMYGITREGNWYKYTGSIEDLENDKWQENAVRCVLSVDPKDHGFIVFEEDGVKVEYVDVVFPVMHGPNGEDGTIQSVCELAGIPCVGCGRLSSSMSMDKEYTHIVCEHFNVPMAKWMSVRKHDVNDYAKLYETVKDTLGIPCIVKPANAGSSFGVNKVKDYDSFVRGMDDAFLYDSKVLIEEFITGFEVGCAVLGNETLTLGEVDEIEMGTEIFDFAEKYNHVTSKIHVPARISKEIKEQVYAYAKVVYRAMECKELSRIDFFVSGDKVYFNELNTIPGFTSASRYPSMLKEVGYSFTEIIRSVITLAMK